MMSAHVDLHIHSDRSSDGQYSPQEIVEMAEQKKLAAIAIADHDTVDAYPDALTAAQGYELEVVPSVELTTRYGRREFHLLLPFVQWDSDAVREIIREVAQRRRREARARVDRLRMLGFSLRWEDVLEESGEFPPIGVTVGLAALKKSMNNGDGRYKGYYDPDADMLLPMKFYQDFFTQGKPAEVPRQSWALPTVLERIKGTGSVPVLAHPGADFMRAGRQDIADLKKMGLQGLEVFTSYHDDKQREMYLHIAHDLDLVPTAGSDFHGSIKPAVSFGSIARGNMDMVRALEKRRL